MSPYDILRNIGLILCALGGYGTLLLPKNFIHTLGIFELGLVGMFAVIFTIICIQLEEITQLIR